MGTRNALVDAVRQELAVARGRKTYDKRTALATRDANRDIERDVAARRRG